jgi:hypothetical protein
LVRLLISYPAKPAWLGKFVVHTLSLPVKVASIQWCIMAICCLIQLKCCIKWSCTCPQQACCSVGCQQIPNVRPPRLLLCIYTWLQTLEMHTRLLFLYLMDSEHVQRNHTCVMTG